MIKKISGAVIALITATMVFFLNKPIGSIPALGMFLSPSHGFWKNTAHQDMRSATLEIQCPQGKATVVYDEIGVPHIFADNEGDLMFAQGYVVAHDRLWQMEFQMHAAAGRLTELVGEKALNLDRFARRIGIVRAAETSLIALEKDPLSKKIVDAFTSGVNAYIDQLKPADLPLEYKLIGYQPEHWTPLKSALLMKYMAKDLTYHDADIENTNALRLFGQENYAKMFPDFPPPAIDPIIPVGTKWGFKSVDSFQTKKNAAQLTAQLYQNPMKHLYANPHYGSNNWAVNGSKTKSGKPILCGDPHLSLNLPSIWYEMQLSCPGMNVYGVTIPGAPGIIIGHNEHIAWSVTNSSRDVINNYSVEYQDAGRKAYKLGDTYVPFTYDVQTFKIRNGKDFIDSIRMTKIGSIVYDERFGETDDRKHIATYWRAEEPSNELMTFYYLNRAKNHQDYLAALDYFSCPGQNFVYADAENNIAIRQQGNFMLRTSTADGVFVQPLASVDVTKLKARIPNVQNPYILNPERGFCSSANQHPTDGTYPYAISGEYENYRNRVINSELTKMSGLTWEQMGQLQNNNLSLLAQEVLPSMLSYLPETLDESSQKLVKALKAWNYNADAPLEAPSYFYIWWDFVEKTAYDEMDNKNTSLRIPEAYVTATLLKNDPGFDLFDIMVTDTVETAKEVTQAAFRKTVAYFKEYEAGNKPATWQMVKNTRLTHLAMLDVFSQQEVNIGGNKHIVNATSDKWGASWRMIVDFSNGKPQCYGVYPGGQSGHPGSPLFTEFVDKWAKGEYYKLHFFTSKEEAIAAFKK